MRRDFEKIASINENQGTVVVKWSDGKVAAHAGDAKNVFMRDYRIYLSKQDMPQDRICDLDVVDDDGNWSREIENENMRKVMTAEEKEKHQRMEDNFDGVVALVRAITKLQGKSDIYVSEVRDFQKNAISALKDSEGFLMNKNVSKWELKRLSKLVELSSECREVGKKINALSLQILEDWVV